MRALITGGSGFVGRVLAEHLAESGDDVVILDRSTGGPNIVDRAATADAVLAASPDVVYHLAAQSHVPTAWKEPTTTLRCNVEGTMNVLDAARLSGARRVVLASSAAVYGSLGDAALPVTESSPPQPDNPYAASKLAAEAVALHSFYGHDQEVVVLRAFNHVGPGQSPNFVCSGFAHRIAKAEQGTDFEIPVGRLDVRRDFSDVRDVVRAYRLAAVSGRPGAVYNVCTGVARTIESIAHGLAERSTADISFVVDDDLVRPIDNPVIYGDASALQADTDWQPLIPFASTLDDILDDARKRVDRSER